MSRTRAALARRATAFAVVAGLLLGQLLGVAHRIAHAPALATDAVSAARVDAHVATTSIAGASPWTAGLAALLPKHDGRQACDAFEHASAGPIACSGDAPTFTFEAPRGAPAARAQARAPTLALQLALARGPPGDDMD